MPPISSIYQPNYLQYQSLHSSISSLSPFPQGQSNSIGMTGGFPGFGNTNIGTSNFISPGMSNIPFTGGSLGFFDDPSASGLLSDFNGFLQTIASGGFGQMFGFGGGFLGNLFGQGGGMMSFPGMMPGVYPNYPGMGGFPQPGGNGHGGVGHTGGNRNTGNAGGNNGMGGVRRNNRPNRNEDVIGRNPTGDAGGNNGMGGVRRNDRPNRNEDVIGRNPTGDAGGNNRNEDVIGRPGKTPGDKPTKPGKPDVTGQPSRPPQSDDSKPIPRDLDFRELDTRERTELGLNDRDRAVLHLWGQQMAAEGRQNGAIINTVLNNTDGDNPRLQFTEAEEELVRELAARDRQRDGGITGRSLDEEFFRVFERVTGEDISERYANRPIEFANGRQAILPHRREGGPEVDSEAWDRELQRRSGLNETELDVMRLWGHEPLFNGGKIDGSSLPYTLRSDNALDNNMDNSVVRSLLRADLASDGELNGDSLRSAFGDVLDRVYGADRTTRVTEESIRQNGVQAGRQAGRTMDQIRTSMTQGVRNALNNVQDMVKNHPVATGMAAGGMIAATAVCPFLGGTMAAGAAAMMGQRRQEQ